MKKKVVLVDLAQHVLVSELATRTIQCVDIQRTGQSRPRPYLPGTASLKRIRAVLLKDVGIYAPPVKTLLQ